MFYDKKMLCQKKICVYCSILFSFFLFSCGFKSEVGAEKKLEKKILTDEVLLILGKDFFEQEDLLRYINQMYNQESLANHLHILSYDDMTTRSQHPRTKLIKEYVDENSTDYIISMGLPEGAGRWMLAAKEKHPTLIVITLLPEESVLPVQVSSTVVVQRADSLDAETADISKIGDSNRLLLLAGLLTAENCKTMPEKEPREQLEIGINTAYIEVFGPIVPATQKGYILLPYIDPDCNIPSYNHFILFEQDLMENTHTEDVP